MIDADLLQKGKELGVIVIDEPNNQVTYRLGKEGKYQWSDPEEQVRAEMVLTIIFEYDYSPSRMATEVIVPSRTPNNPADIVVFRDDRRRDPYITVEVVAPRLSDAERLQKVEQLFGYANALASEFAVFYDGDKLKQYWRVQGEGGLERERNVISVYHVTMEMSRHTSLDGEVRKT
jgi:type I restriction enzyme M protein